MARTLQSIFIPGPAGQLEALLEEHEAPSRIEQAVILCHPHPQFGGTMHNKVVYRMAKAARGNASAVLRFNFRGVGASSGTYDGGRGEQNDLRAALRYMQERYPGTPMVVAGFSFGSRIALGVCCGEPGVDRTIAIGTPVKTVDSSYLSHCGCPKHFIHSVRDEFGPRKNLEEILKAAAGPTSITWIDAEDHFFSDALDTLESTVREVLARAGA